MWLTNVIFENKTIVGERIELNAKDALYYLGPDLTLQQCTLSIQVPARRLLLRGPRLIGCRIDVKKQLKGFQWYDSFLNNCRFTGRFVGNDFGHRPDAKSGAGNGGVEDCDFSSAVLEGCRFFNCDMGGIRLPRWPCFTLMEPYKRHRELAAFPWPGMLGLAMDFSQGPETTVAVTYLATSLAKQFETTEAEIKAALMRVADVFY